MAPTETPPRGNLKQLSELLSKTRHDLKTPLNQIIGYGEMLLEDATDDSVKTKLESLLDSARACLDVQAKALQRPVEEVDSLVWEALRTDHAARTSGMNSLLIELRAESGAAAADDLDRLLQAVGNLERLAHDAPAHWADSAGAALKEQPALKERSVVMKPVFAPGTDSGIFKLSEPVVPGPGPALGRLLVVDDNDVNRDMLSRRLIREGYSVALAQNGREALEKLASEAFDLMLLDIVMPELDGFGVLQQVRANPDWKDTPVIMISALDEISSVVRCIEMGAEDYLPKPFDPVLLRARIGAILERRRLRDGDRKRATQMEAAWHEADLQKEAGERMLRNILPAKVATELRERGSVEPMYFEDVTIGFTDFVGFTLSTERLAAEELVGYLHEYFTAFDRIMDRYGLEKMKTIGDSYMFVSGLPERQPSHPVDAILAALEIVEAVKNMASPEGVEWKVRVGLHTGPVIAGVVGIHKFAFDIWGDSVNFASRMESSGEANRVNVSERTYTRIKDFMHCTARGRVHTKDGREVDMFFVDGAHDKLLSGTNAAIPEGFARRYKIYFQKEMTAFPEFLKNVKACSPHLGSQTPIPNS